MGAYCAGLSPELRCWQLQIGNLSIDMEGMLWWRRAPPAEGSQLVVPRNERRAMIRRFHDSLFAGHLGISRTIYRLQTRVYWPGLCNHIQTYIASLPVCIARKSPCPRRAPYAMTLELPSFLGELEVLKGMSPNVQLNFKPWGHDKHEDVDCECQASDRTVAYVHDLTVNRRGPVDSSGLEVASNIRPEPDWRKGLPGLVPFVSCRPGAYDHLLLTVSEWWRTDLLVSADWLRPVTRGGWRTGFPDRGHGSADVS